jgi:hypothetical protein
MIISTDGAHNRKIRILFQTIYQTFYLIQKT